MTIGQQRLGLVSFDSFYYLTLAKLGLNERLADDPHGNVVTYLERPSLLFGFIPWPFGEPEIVGRVLQKPMTTRGGGLIGCFRVMAACRGPVWLLAYAIERETGLESEVEVCLDFPA